MLGEVVTTSPTSHHLNVQDYSKLYSIATPMCCVAASTSVLMVSILLTKIKNNQSKETVNVRLDFGIIVLYLSLKGCS